jgi:FixJ family two-component response regulator
MLTKKFALAAASAMLVTTVAFASNARPAYAATKVDCDAVMNEVNSGKKAKEIATDLSISTSSVYRCKRHAKAAAKAADKSSMQAKSGKEAPMAPAMAAPSPAMAAPAAAASPK